MASNPNRDNATLRQELSGYRMAHPSHVFGGMDDNGYSVCPCGAVRKIGIIGAKCTVQASKPCKRRNLPDLLGTHHFTQLQLGCGRNKVNIPGYFQGEVVFDKCQGYNCGYILSYAENDLTGERWASSDGFPFPWSDLVNAEGPEESIELGEILAISAGVSPMPKSVVDKIRRNMPNLTIPASIEIENDYDNN